MGIMTPPSRKSCYNFRCLKINRVVDGDTIDVTIDLGFDLQKKERVRVAGVDTPEKRTRNKEEKVLGIDATNWIKAELEAAIKGEDDLIIRTELKGGVGKYGRLLGLVAKHPKRILRVLLVSTILEVERRDLQVVVVLSILLSRVM